MSSTVRDVINFLKEANEYIDEQLPSEHEFLYVELERIEYREEVLKTCKKILKEVRKANNGEPVKPETVLCRKAQEIYSHECRGLLGLEDRIVKSESIREMRSKLLRFLATSSSG